MTDILTSIKLKNGIVVDFFDQTNRYYGDFHRVKIDIVASFPVDSTQLPSELQSLAAECGNTATHNSTLEQMGVQSADLERVRAALIDNFMITVGCYFEKDNFVESLLRKKLRQVR